MASQLNMNYLIMTLNWNAIKSAFNWEHKKELKSQNVNAEKQNYIHNHCKYNQLIDNYTHYKNISVRTVNYSNKSHKQCDDKH